MAVIRGYQTGNYNYNGVDGLYRNHTDCGTGAHGWQWLKIEMPHKFKA